MSWVSVVGVYIKSFRMMCKGTTITLSNVRYVLLIIIL